MAVTSSRSQGTSVTSTCVDPRVQGSGSGPRGRDEQVQHVDVGPQLLQRWPREQHVTVAVQANGEDLAPGAAVTHGATPG